MIKCNNCHRRVKKEDLTKLGEEFYCEKCTDIIVKDAVKVAIEQENIELEKRRFKRIRILSPIELILSQKKREKGIIIDISIGNLGVITDRQLPVNKKMPIKFILPNDNEVIQIEGGITRSNKIGNKYYSGVSIMNPGHYRKKIKNFVFQNETKKYIVFDKKISFV